MGSFIFYLGLFVFLAITRVFPFQYAEIVGIVLMAVGLILMYPRRV